MPPAPAQQLEKAIARIQDARSRNEPIAIGALVFAGGFSFGVEEAGFNVCAHLELPDMELGSDISAKRWPTIVAPLDDAYQEKGRHWHGDRTTLRLAMKKIAEAAGPAGVDFLHTNPPCSAFAKQGDRAGMDDEVMRFTKYCAFDIALVLKPKVWCWELVPGVFDDEAGRGFINDTAAKAAEHGYQSYCFLTSSALHGGFMNRERFHFVSSKVKLDFDAVYASEPDSRKGFKTLGDALAIVEAAVAQAKLEGRVISNHDPDDRQGGGQLINIIPYCPPGGYLREVHDEVMKLKYRPYGREWDGSGRAGVTQVRGKRDRPCPVIVGGHTVIHPDEDRFLTVREAATVMGFPISYGFSHRSTGYKEVGKGLCTHNASFVARSVLQGLRNNAVISSDEITGVPLVTDWRGRAGTPSLSSTPEEREAWWKIKHPELPIEWARGRPKGKPGRPPGSSGTRKNRPSDEEANETTVVGTSSKKLFELLQKGGVETLFTPVEKMLEETTTVTGPDGIDTVETKQHPTGQTDYAKTIVNCTGVDILIVPYPMSPDDWLQAGACLGAGGQVVQVHNMELSTGVNTPGFQSIVAMNDQSAAIAVAEVAGVSKQEFAAALVKGMDPMDLLALLTKSA